MLVGWFLALGLCAQAKDIQFGGYDWAVRSGRGGPGPNAWDENNVWLDSATNLHLKISQRGGRWSCAEVMMRTRLCFGRYQFQTSDQVLGELTMLIEEFTKLTRDRCDEKAIGVNP